jgi:hypothetical protein
VSAASSRPVVELEVASLPVPGWRLLRPIWIGIAQDEDGWFIASSPDVLIHGEGLTPPEAFADFCEYLVEYYEIMTDSCAVGSQQDPRLQEYLRGLLARI